MLRQERYHNFGMQGHTNFEFGRSMLRQSAVNTKYYKAGQRTRSRGQHISLRQRVPSRFTTRELRGLESLKVI